MTKSIVQTKKECYICRTTENLHRHHIYYGRKDRPQSERFGCWCWLCARHHNFSDEGVHFNKELDDELKDLCQRVFELTYPDVRFTDHFFKNNKQSKYDEGDYKCLR